LNKALAELAEVTQISPSPETVEARPPVIGRRKSAGSIRSNRANPPQVERRNSNRSMRGRPSTSMRYFGMDRLEEDAEEGKLFA
jgi:hypothetical protein